MLLDDRTVASQRFLRRVSGTDAQARRKISIRGHHRVGAANSLGLGIGFVSASGEPAGPTSFGGGFDASKQQCSDRPSGALIWINDAHVANVSPSIAIVLQILSKTTLRRILSHGDPCCSEAEQ